MFSVIYRLFGDRSCFLIKSTRLPSETSLPPPTRLTLPLSLILSLIFPTWVMAFVIPNDSRNKSAVMRSHWVRFFLSLKSPFTARHSQPVPETQTGSCIRAPVNQQETDQFLPREDLPAAKMDTLSSWACVFFPTSKTLLSFDSLELISCVNATCYVSKLSLMTSLAYLLIYLAFLLCVFADL